jgi:hypothetical protein
MISLGAGVQSSTMALMAAKGEITPMPKCAIFADTQAEPAIVYKWLDWLEQNLPFPVHRVSYGNLTSETLKLRRRVKSEGNDYNETNIPVFILNPDGTRGIGKRQCTSKFKIRMIERMIREQMKRQDKESVTQWIGISADEIYRMKPSRLNYVVHRWPLVELNMHRESCLRWMKDAGFPTPPRSACIYCPYHSASDWRNMEPSEFQAAVQFEKDLQSVRRIADNKGGIPFLHNSCKPLGEVDFSTEEERGQLNMFNNECEGMCGV